MNESPTTPAFLNQPRTLDQETQEPHPTITRSLLIDPTDRPEPLCQVLEG